MAFRKIAAAGLILAMQLGAAQVAITADEEGIHVVGKKRTFYWKYEDIQRLTLLPTGLHILTYKDRTLKFTAPLPTEDLYRRWSAKLDQRLVVGQAFAQPGEKIPARHRKSEGVLTISSEIIAYDGGPADSRTWRYKDILNVSSSGPFQLTITTFEKQFDFQLKQPITEARYNQLWLDIERKNGKLK